MTAVRVRVDAYAWFLELLDAVGSGPVGGKVRQCPAHHDASPSLSVDRGRDGRVLLRCHAGCDTRAILAALHCPAGRLFRAAPMTPAQFARTFCAGVTFPELDYGRGGNGGWIAVRIDEHPYGDPDTVAWKVRERNAAGVKRMRWESLNPHGERVPGLLGRREANLPLYRAREVRMAVAANELVVLVESESSVDALTRAGIYATTWAGGASSPPLTRIAHDLRNANVLVVPDFDDAGLTCAERIIDVVPNARVQVGEPGEDARDILTRCGPQWFR